MFIRTKDDIMTLPSSPSPGLDLVSLQLELMFEHSSFSEVAAGWLVSAEIFRFDIPLAALIVLYYVVLGSL